MQARKSLIDLEAMIVQNRMDMRKSQLIIASAELVHTGRSVLHLLYLCALFCVMCDV